jgi:hypothetical protein
MAPTRALCVESLTSFIPTIATANRATLFLLPGGSFVHVRSTVSRFRYSVRCGSSTAL